MSPSLLDIARLSVITVDWFRGKRGQPKRKKRKNENEKTKEKKNLLFFASTRGERERGRESFYDAIIE